MFVGHKPNGFVKKLNFVKLTSLGKVINLALESIFLDVRKRPEWHKNSILIPLILYIILHSQKLNSFAKNFLNKLGKKLIFANNFSYIFVLQTEVIKYDLKHI